MFNGYSLVGLERPFQRFLFTHYVELAFASERRGKPIATGEKGNQT